jgi:hypothetical protein
VLNPTLLHFAPLNTLLQALFDIFLKNKLNKKTPPERGFEKSA